MPQFTKASIRDVRDIRPRENGTERNPTVAFLLSQKDHTGWREVRVPKVTKAMHVQYAPVVIGSLKMEPGETRLLPPELADEVDAAIARFEAVPMQQVTGKMNLSKGILSELAEQADFEKRRAQAEVLIAGAR